MSESYFQFLDGERINSSHWSIGWIVIKMWFIGCIQKRNCSLSAQRAIALLDASINSPFEISG